MSHIRKCVDSIALKSVAVYKKLPKKGKPDDSEWTVLSSVLQYDIHSGSLEVVSLGTGSKCVGPSLMSSKGDILNDSHAEVVARRGFLIYLYDQIEKTLNERDSIFTIENGKFKLKSYIQFAFYSSQMPCGDASIIDNEVDETVSGSLLQSGEQDAEGETYETYETYEPEMKRSKLTTSLGKIQGTGAKCLPQNEQDLKVPGKIYHILSQVRTKPGNGERTLSVSCSDKIAKWARVGVQGALLDILLYEPIYIKAFVFGGNMPYSEESLKRAILIRDNEDCDIPCKQIPEFHQSWFSFPHTKSENRQRPAPTSIIWINMDDVYLEVAAKGLKLGMSAKHRDNPNFFLCISKYKLYRKFLKLVKKYNLHIEGCSSSDSLSLVEMKKKSERYSEAWNNVKEFFFKTWTEKPDLENFTVDL